MSTKNEIADESKELEINHFLHAIKNKLTIMNGYISMLTKKYGESEFDPIILNIDRINDLVNKIYECSSKDEKVNDCIIDSEMSASVTLAVQEKCTNSDIDHLIGKPVILLEKVTKLPDTSKLDVAIVKVSSESVMNIVRFQQNFKGMEDILTKIVSEFISCYIKMLNQVREALYNQDSGQLELAAHSLKGAVATFHAAPAVAAAYKLECIGKSGELSEALEAYVNLVSETERLVVALEALNEKGGLDE